MKSEVKYIFLCEFVFCIKRTNSPVSSNCLTSLILSVCNVVAAKTTAPASHAGVLFIVAAVIGGLIALLGIAIAFRSSGGNADISATLPSGGSIKLRGVGQGVVIALIGAGVLVAALYFYPQEETIVTTETKTIEDGDENSTIHRTMSR